MRATRILKLNHHDAVKERDFELRHQMTLTTQERFEAMMQFSIELLKLAEKHGHRKTPQIVKRS